MASSVTAFGYSVPLVVVLVFLALVIGLALVVSFWFTIGWSIYRSVGTTRRDQVRRNLQSALIDRLFDESADWKEWVDSLSTTERTVTEELLDEYLRELDGQNRRRLQELGDVLGIPERSIRQLETGGEYARLQALTWLTLLERPTSEREADWEPQTSRERASKVRLHYESDTLHSTKSAIEDLLEGVMSEFTVFGQDTLYRLAIDDPAALFDVAEANYRTWSQALLLQVLTVCQHLGTSVTGHDLGWLIAVLEHQNESVRAAGARALGNVGWRSDIRDDPFVDRLLSDPSPRVRSAVYGMLVHWGDEQALEQAIAALEREDDPRARLDGTTDLVRRRERLGESIDERLEATWDWSREHAEYDRLARRGREVGQ